MQKKLSIKAIIIMINDLINNISLLDIQKKKTINFLKNS